MRKLQWVPAAALVLASWWWQATAHAVCAGDCDGDRTVTVDEIVTMVNIALGSRPVADCLAGDRSGDGEITVDEIVTAVNNALGECPAEGGPLGDRRFTLSANSEFRAVLSTGFSIPLGSFRGQKDGVLGDGYLILRAGEPDASGLATIDIPEASDYFFVDARNLAQIVLCLKPIVPIRGAGVLNCRGGQDYSIALSANHRVGKIGEEDGFTLAQCLASCTSGGCGQVEGPDQICSAGLVGEVCRSNADCDTSSGAGDGVCGLGRYCTRGRLGETCTSDEDCRTEQGAGVCRAQPTCTQGKEGSDCRADADCDTSPGEADGACGPRGVHPGVCNGAFSISTLGEDSGAGAAVLAPVFGLAGFPAELSIERNLPCGDEQASGFSQTFAFTTGGVQGQIENANARVGETLQFTTRGENFSCDNWTNPTGPGCFALVAPALHTFQGNDLITSFRFCGR